MTANIPNGSWPVMFTPFTESNEVDYDALDSSLEFYIETQQAGLFPNALSGEVFNLTLEECTRIARRLVDRSAGRIPIVSSGNLGDTLEQQAESMRIIQDTGVEAVVILLSALPERENLADQILKLTEKVEAPLGVYECPVPEHRHLSAEEVRTLAETGRFVFMKETSRSVPTFTEKMKAAEGTPLKLFQANLRCTPGSLENGAPGVCGIFSNFCPEWTARLCEIGKDPSEESEALMRGLIAFHDVAMTHGYPSSGKYFVQKRGVDIRPISRKYHQNPFNDGDKSFIDRFLEGLDPKTPSLSREELNQLVEELGTAPLVD